MTLGSLRSQYSCLSRSLQLNRQRPGTLQAIPLSAGGPSKRTGAFQASTRHHHRRKASLPSRVLQSVSTERSHMRSVRTALRVQGKALQSRCAMAPWRRPGCHLGHREGWLPRQTMKVRPEEGWQRHLDWQIRFAAVRQSLGSAHKPLSAVVAMRNRERPKRCLVQSALDGPQHDDGGTVTIRPQSQRLTPHQNRHLKCSACAPEL